MKKLNQILFGLIALTVISSSCDSLLDVESDRLMFPENHKIDAPNDSIYSMVGIFTKLQKLADSYVLLGELRGDLMDVTENASAELREINNLDISADNPYNVIEDYYSVINHCNFLINNIDTMVSSGGEKSLLKEYAAAKAIRAWTYLQIALNYGTAKYYTEPLLTVQDSKGDFPEYDIEGLVKVLIPDLEPLKFTETPGGISLGPDMTSEKLYFPIPLILGELYLWDGKYENAAREYYYLIEKERYVVNNNFSSTWRVDNGVFVDRLMNNQNFLDIFELTNNEQITMIASSTELGGEDVLYQMTYRDYEIAPSQAAIDTWDEQTYYYNANATTPGDLRGLVGSYSKPGYIYGFSNESNAIIKYYLMWNQAEVSRAVMIYRVATLYLRYAEAVNRAGKPNLAFAVLKNGMNMDALEVDTIVPRHEKYSVYTDSTGTFLDYVNFSAFAFEQNVGIHSRGCGNIDRAIDYVIPADKTTKEDSMLWVEERIIDELALETAFEGNRFQDLMRISLRRGNPEFLAEKIAKKHIGNESAILTTLKDEANWYLPKK